MSDTKHITINLKNLSAGKETFKYELTDTYFEHLSDAEIRRGHVTVVVDIEPHEAYFDVCYATNGEVTIACDRCLDDMEQHVEGTDSLVVRYGNSETSTDEEIYVDERTAELDLTWLVYEQIALSLPLKHVHADGQCNPEMVSHILGTDNEQTTTQTDPRWDGLKQILN